MFNNQAASDGYSVFLRIPHDPERSVTCEENVLTPSKPFRNRWTQCDKKLQECWDNIQNVHGTMMTSERHVAAIVWLFLISPNEVIARSKSLPSSTTAGSHSPR